MKNIKREIKEQYKKYCESYKKEIEEAKKEAENGDSYRLDHYFRRYLTKKQFEKLKNDEITTKEAIQKTIEKEKAQNEKSMNNTLKKLEDIKQADKFKCCNIIVEWVNSKTWGANPHVTAQIWTEDKQGLSHYEEYYGKASGCGYDKQSAAIGEALNQSKSIIQAFCEYKEKQLKKNKNADKSDYAIIDNRNAICYGFGYSPIPYFEGGVGVNCFIQGFKLLGYKTTEAHGNASDFYSITKI